MRRFYIAPEQLLLPEPCLTGDEAKHILQVLRMAVGQDVFLFDNSGYEYRARISALKGSRVCVEIMDRQYVPRESPLLLTLGLPLIRSQALEWVLQKGTELGVISFLPYYSARSRRNFQKMKWDSRKGRWKKIILEAGKQCGRNSLPRLLEPVSFEQMMERGKGTPGIIPYEGESSRTLTGLELPFPLAGELLALVGPEGGFEKEEIVLAEREGFIPFSLGPRILRSETAALAIICLLQFLWGDMGSKRKGGIDALP